MKKFVIKSINFLKYALLGILAILLLPFLVIYIGVWGTYEIMRNIKFCVELECSSKNT